MSTPTFEAVAVGDSIGTRTYTLTRADLVRYAGASGDFNPIHWNPRFAAEVGLPDVIAHGMLTMATAGRLVTEWVGDPGAIVSYGSRFPALVPVPDDADGATLEVSGTIAVRDEAARTVRVDLTAVAGGQKVLGKAQVVVRLP